MKREIFQRPAMVRVRPLARDLRAKSYAAFAGRAANFTGPDPAESVLRIFDSAVVLNP